LAGTVDNSVLIGSSGILRRAVRWTIHRGHGDAIEDVTVCDLAERLIETIHGLHIIRPGLDGVSRMPVEGTATRQKAERLSAI